VTATLGNFSQSAGLSLQALQTSATNSLTALIRQTGAGGNGNQDIGLVVDIQGANDQDRIVNFRYFDGTNYNSRFVVQRNGFVGIATAGYSVNHTLSLGRVFGFAQDINSGYIQANMANSGNYIVSQYAVRIHLDTALGEITFLNAPSGTAGNSVTLTPIMRMSNNGNVGINTTNPSNKLHVVSASSGVSARTDLGGNIIAEGSTRAGLYILTSGTDAGSYGSIWWGNGNTNTDAFITVNNSTRAMAFGTADGTRLTIASNGLATFTGDVKVKTLEVTNVGTDATSSGVSTYMRITVNGQNYLIPLHGTP
jgi:hypothetical protein